jgi:hypothetical protein
MFIHMSYVGEILYIMFISVADLVEQVILSVLTTMIDLNSLARTESAKVVEAEGQHDFSKSIPAIIVITPILSINFLVNPAKIDPSSQGACCPFQDTAPSTSWEWE